MSQDIEIDASAPIKLLSPSADHRGLVLEPEGLEALRRLKGEVAVVTIVGPQRGGESTKACGSKKLKALPFPQANRPC